MGLFDFLGTLLQNSTETCQKAQMQAEYWDIKKICRELNMASGMATCTGYANVLRDKCKKLSDYELKELFDEVHRNANVRAFNALIPVMLERDLIYKDDDGKIRKNY